MPTSAAYPAWIRRRKSQIRLGLGPTLGAAKPNSRIGPPELRLKPLGDPGTVRGLAPRSSSDHLVLSVLRSFGIAIEALGVILVVVGVMDPLCDIARHVIQSVRTPTRFELPRRSQVLVTVLLAVQIGMHRRQRVAPRILAIPFSLGRLLPLGLRRETLARPLAIGGRVRPRHPHRSQLRFEDLGYIVIKHRDEGLASLGAPDEPVIFSLRDLILIDVKGGQVDLVFRCFVVVTIIASHLERTFRDFNHLASVISHNRFVEAEVRRCGRDGLGLLGRGGGLRQELLVLCRVAGQRHHAYHHQKKRPKRGDDPDHQPFILHRRFSPSEGGGACSRDAFDCWRSSMSIPICTPRKPPTAPPEAAPRGTAPVPETSQARPPPTMAPHTMLTKNRSEEHTSELQSRLHLVCRLLLEKKKPTHADLPPTLHQC